jgi:hypothetical protein
MPKGTNDDKRQGTAPLSETYQPAALAEGVSILERRIDTSSF